METYISLPNLLAGGLPASALPVLALVAHRGKHTLAPHQRAQHTRATQKQIRHRACSDEACGSLCPSASTKWLKGEWNSPFIGIPEKPNMLFCTPCRRERWFSLKVMFRQRPDSRSTVTAPSPQGGGRPRKCTLFWLGFCLSFFMFSGVHRDQKWFKNDPKM